MRGALPTGRGARRRQRDEKGVALLVTILVIALLATFTFEMSYMTLIDMNVARNVADDTRLTFIAEAGIGAARAALALDRKNNQTDNLNEMWSGGAPIRALPLGDAIVAVDIVDEERKIPLNSLVTAGAEGEGPKVNEALLGTLERLLETLEIEPSVAEAIVDWIDPDDLPYGQGGAESLYYGDLRPAYPVRNGPFATLEELRLVRGLTAEVFGLLSPFVTVYPSAAKLNLNTVSKEVLMATSEEMDETRVEELIEYRAETPFESAEKVKEYLEGFSPPLADPAALASLFDVKSDHFTILSQATLMPEGEAAGMGESSLGEELREADRAESGGGASRGRGEGELTVRQKAQRAGNTKSILATLRRASDGKGELLYWRVD